MNTLSTARQIQILSLLTEGNSIRGVERLTGTHRDTVMRLLVKYGNKAQRVLNNRMEDLKPRKMEIDEIWTYVKKKQKMLTSIEVYYSKASVGDHYVFVAIDPETKIVPTFLVGKRTKECTYTFVSDLASRITAKYQLTSDGFAAYEEVIKSIYSPGTITYGQLVKEIVYEGNRKRLTITKKPILGRISLKNISTSIIERQNLTMRTQMRRFTRLTNAYSKKLENLKAAVALHFYYYNFIRIHQTLRMTPAMKAGLTKNIWHWETLINNT